MSDRGSMRVLTRWSLVALGVIAVLVILYYLTGGFGAPAPVAP
jgi:hypothetical protein